MQGATTTLTTGTMTEVGRTAPTMALVMETRQHCRPPRAPLPPTARPRRPPRRRPPPPPPRPSPYPSRRTSTSTSAARRGWVAARVAKAALATDRVHWGLTPDGVHPQRAPATLSTLGAVPASGAWTLPTARCVHACARPVRTQLNLSDATAARLPRPHAVVSTATARRQSPNALLALRLAPNCAAGCDLLPPPPRRPGADMALTWC